MRPQAPSPPLDAPVSPGCVDVSELAELSGVAVTDAEPRDQGLRRTQMNTISQLLWVAWHFLRQVSGDDAYERYLDHMLRAHPGHPPMRRGEYYRFRTEQKWNRITRCC